MFSTYLQQSLQPLRIWFSALKWLSNFSHCDFSSSFTFFFSCLFCNIFNTTAARILYTYSIHLTIAQNSQPCYSFCFETKTDAAAKANEQSQMFGQECTRHLAVNSYEIYIADITPCYSVPRLQKECCYGHLPP